MMDDCLQRNNNKRVMWAGADLTLTVYTTSFFDYLTHIPCSSGGFFLVCVRVLLTAILHYVRERIRNRNT
jgi:hypothetical protein